ncbi:MAG: UDP-N-acetylmuramoyl-L-alanine--D-glutamate ligase [Eubacteriales bacterium]
MNFNTASLIGYGVSNKAALSYFTKNGIHPTVRCEKPCDLPLGTLGIFGDGYLLTNEDFIIRSPSVRPDKISGRGYITTEASFAMSLTKSKKIGVTGSDGKSTTSTLIYLMLEKTGKAYLCGNIGKPVIDFAPCAEENSFIVAELSSFQLMDFTASLDTCVVTNITENHLNWHTSMGEYIDAKKNIVLNSSRAVLNYDDFTVREFASCKPPEDITFFSLKETKKPEECAHFVTVEGGYLCYDGIKIIKTDEIRLRGKFNLMNAMASVGAAFEYVPTDDIREVLSSFEGVKSRMQLVGKVGGVSFFDSSIDSTPSRTAATVSAFDKPKTVIILGGYDKNLTYDILGEALCGIKAIVICGENREKIYESVFDVCDDITVTENFDEAVTQAFSKAKCGDSVLLSPASASFDMFENYRERSLRFCKIVSGLKKNEN